VWSVCLSVHASHPHWTSTIVPVRLCIHSFRTQWQIPAEVDWLSGFAFCQEQELDLENEVFPTVAQPPGTLILPASTTLPTPVHSENDSRVNFMIVLTTDYCWRSWDVSYSGALQISRWLIDWLSCWCVCTHRMRSWTRRSRSGHATLTTSRRKSTASSTSRSRTTGRTTSPSRYFDTHGHSMSYDRAFTNPGDSQDTLF